MIEEVPEPAPVREIIPDSDVPEPAPVPEIIRDSVYARTRRR